MKPGMAIFLTLLGAGAVGGGIWYAASRSQAKLPPTGGTSGGNTGGLVPSDEPGHGPGPGIKPKPNADVGLGGLPGKFAGILSQQTNGGTWCGMPILPRGTMSYEGSIREITPDAGPVWGYQAPGGQPVDRNPAAKWGPRFIAMLTPKTITPLGWDLTLPAKPGQIGSAKYLAGLVGGVAFAGIIPSAMLPVLREFSSRGVDGYPIVFFAPQGGVFDPQKPRARLSAVLDSWRKPPGQGGAGFAAMTPILDASSGEANLAEMVDECVRLGLDFMLLSLQSVEQLKINCAFLGA